MRSRHLCIVPQPYAQRTCWDVGGVLIYLEGESDIANLNHIAWQQRSRFVRLKPASVDYRAMLASQVENSVSQPVGAYQGMMSIGPGIGDDQPIIGVAPDSQFARTQ